MTYMYRYGCRERPPGPGAVPREGLYYCYDGEYYDRDRHRCWGFVDYDRPLSPEEKEHYSLTFIAVMERKEEPYGGKHD